jgi:DNA-directed RNA polymerase specialized sigma24 family protein
MSELDANDNDEKDAPGKSPGCDPLIPALPPRYTRPPEVEVDLVTWYGHDKKAQRSLLQAMGNGKSGLCPEALVHICVQAFARNQERLVNLAFHALTVSATRRVLYPAKGVRDADKVDHAQAFFTHLFALITKGKAQFAEVCFAALCKRFAISQLRKRKARFEGKLQQEFVGEEDEGEAVDPLDAPPASGLSPEMQVLANLTLEALPEPIRSVFIQHHQFDFTQEELAARHGVSARTIRNWLSKAATILGMKGEEK